MAAGAWSDDENDAIIADYFAMLAADLSGHAYNKAEYNRALQVRTGRGRGSIEYKHQNISAVLKGFGEVWIEGYKPAFNYQSSLEDAVRRWLDGHREWIERPPVPAAAHAAAWQEGRPLWIGPPPTARNAPPPEEAGQMAAAARKFDVAQRDERNRVLGRAGEELVLWHERSVLTAAGREDLADGVRWVSEVDDGAGFDIASFRPDGSDRLIEVKTTRGWERTPFHISANELRVAEQRREDWQLLRLWNFDREPRAFELRPPLDAHVELTPTSFRASFG